jgi:hypothetical protein
MTEQKNNDSENSENNFIPEELLIDKNRSICQYHIHNWNMLKNIKENVDSITYLEVTNGDGKPKKTCITEVVLNIYESTLILRDLMKLYIIIKRWRYLVIPILILLFFVFRSDNFFNFIKNFFEFIK